MPAAQDSHVRCIGVIETRERRRWVDRLATAADADPIFLAAAAVRAFGRGHGARAVVVACHEKVAAAGLVAITAAVIARGHAGPVFGRGWRGGGREGGTQPVPNNTRQRSSQRIG